MRRILIVLLMMVAGVAHARILHVGDNTIKLSQTKTTTPALHVRVGDEVWYGNMTTHSSTQKLHIKYNDKTYTVCNGEKLKNGNYDFAGDCLIGANENVYLESTGTQWIDTGFIPNQDTKIEAEYQFLSTSSSAGYTQAHVGCGAGTALNDKRFAFAIKNNKWYFAIGIQIHPDDTADLNKHIFILDARNKRAWIDNKYYDMDYQTLQSDYSFALFTRNDKTSVTAFRHAAKSFYTKIYEDDVLVRHFVPVPCGLKIGDFVVPENGMWDIVEQKFYGNMGTGEFIYGVD